jgi:hypothetical protein
MPRVARERALSVCLDAVLIALAVDLPAAALLFGLSFLPEAPLGETGIAAFALFVLLFLCRDATGGFSRKWLGFRIEDGRGRPPGFWRSVLRNLPLVVPGWNVYEGIRVLRQGAEPRPVDRLLGLAHRPIP